MLPITFLGIQKNELNLFSEQIRKIDYKAKQIVVPLISARIEAINDKDPRKFTDKKNRSFWLMEKGEYLGQSSTG